MAKNTSKITHIDKNPIIKGKKNEKKVERGPTKKELRKEIELAVKDKSGKNVANINSLPLTKQAEKVIRVTVLEAKALKSPMVETEHLLLSILKNKENIATQILNQFDIDYDLFRTELGMIGSNIDETSIRPSAEFPEVG